MRGAFLVRARGGVLSLSAILIAMCFAGSANFSSAQSQSSEGSRASGSQAFEAVSKRADEARDAGKLEEAEKLYREALTLNPKWTEGWWSLGTLYYDGDRYAEAQLAFEKVVALDPKQGTARAMLGLSEFELGQADKALDNIEASKTLGVLEDQQLRDVVMYHEGVLLQRAGRFEAANTALSSLCLGGVRSGELVSTFGMVALRIRDTAAPSPSTQAGQIVQHVGWAACLSGAKDYDGARREFEKIIAIAPHYPMVHYAYGHMLLDARDNDEAIKQFEAEIEEQPNSVLPRLRIAAAEYKRDPAAGVKYAEEAVKLQPDLPLGHYLLGLLLLQTGDYVRAIPELETARKAFPQESKIDISLASAYTQVGRTQDAARARADFMRKKQAEQGTDSAVEITDAMETRSTQ
jgi:tetratricopeptide (TPR) repeat protein